MDNAVFAKVVLTYISVLQWLFVCIFKNLHALFYMALMLKIIFNKICNYYICAIYYFTVKTF